MELLLEHGAHIDVRNAYDQKPADMLREIPGCKVNALNYTTLKCLAAAVVAKSGVEFRGEVPKQLEEFIRTH